MTFSPNAVRVSGGREVAEPRVDPLDALLAQPAVVVDELRTGSDDGVGSSRTGASRSA